MAFWYCDICGWKVPARPDDEEPKYCAGHDETDDITFGMFWSLHETCKVCDQEYTVGTFLCPKCKSPTDDDALENTPPPRPPSPGCSGCMSQGCFVSFIGFTVVAGVVVSRAIKSSTKHG